MFTIIFGIKNCAILIGIQVSRFRFFQTNLRSCRGRPGLRGVRRPTHAGSWYEARTRPDFASLGTCDLTAVEKEHMYMMLHYMYMCICNIYIYIISTVSDLDRLTTAACSILYLSIWLQGDPDLLRDELQQMLGQQLVQDLIPLSPPRKFMMASAFRGTKWRFMILDFL